MIQLQCHYDLHISKPLFHYLYTGARRLLVEAFYQVKDVITLFFTVLIEEIVR